MVPELSLERAGEAGIGHQRRVGYFLRELSSEIDSLIAAAQHIRGAVERQHRRRQWRNDGDQRPAAGVAVELRVVVRPSGPRSSRRIDSNLHPSTQSAICSDRGAMATSLDGIEQLATIPDNSDRREEYRCAQRIRALP